MPQLTERFVEACAYCLDLHHGQVSKGKGTPYVAHLLGVAGLVLEDGGSEDEAIAALLHDSLEDQPQRVSEGHIRERFGGTVLDLVRSCTDTPDDYEGGPKPPWRQRKEQYLEHVRQAPNRVALADKVHNARQLLADYRHVGESLWERFNAGRDEQLWYYRSLVTAFRAAGVAGFLMGELEATVDELARMVTATQRQPPGA